jgi:hypothetical protein
MHVSLFDFNLYDAMRARLALKRNCPAVPESKPEPSLAGKAIKRAKVKAARKQRRRQS